jgi:transposase
MDALSFQPWHKQQCWEAPMHRDRPVVIESAEQLKVLLKQQPNRHKRQRLHALYLFASDQVTTRQQAALLLGVHRETLGRWMSLYASGGLAALLDLYVPKGKPPALSQAVIAALEQQLQQPKGFASFESMRVWLFETYAVTISAKTLQKFVRRRFGARPKVARPSHIKKPEGSE